MLDLRAWVDIFDYFVNIYRQNAKPVERNYKLCERYASFSQLIIITISVMYVCAGFAYQGSKYLEYFSTGVLRPPIGIYFPKVNESGTLGVAAMNLTNIIGDWIGVIVVSTFDMLIYFVFANIVLASTVIQREIRAFELALKSSEMPPDEIKKRLLEIVHIHLDYNEYKQANYYRCLFNWCEANLFRCFLYYALRIIKKLDEGFGRTAFLQISSSTFYLVFSIFISVKVSFSIYISIKKMN